MPVVTTAKKDSPSNRASRLDTASYLVSSSLTPLCVGHARRTRLAEIGCGVPGEGPAPPPELPPQRCGPRFRSIMCRPSACFCFQSRRSSARSRASVFATMRWFSRCSFR